jgi:hypothetical protein
LSALDLKGRNIPDVQFSGLVERLCRISAVCVVAGETKEHLSKNDLMSFISAISESVGEAFAFSLATPEEIARVNEHVLNGASVEPVAPN